MSSNKLPADLLTRHRLDGCYHLLIAAITDISKPCFDADEVTTIHGSSARNMSLGEEEVGDENFSKKRLHKVVFADAFDKLLIGYEYRRWDDAIIGNLKVGAHVELIGPIVLNQGLALLTAENISASLTSTVIPQHSASQLVELMDDSWMLDIPSDMFHDENEHNVIIIND